VFVIYRKTEGLDTQAEAAQPAPEAVAVAVPAERPRLDVHSLDFRKVGIQSWKVKVRIGLVYDFGDYKTLRKYIQDGRVTPDDLLSHDGQDWKPIGDIPDLEQHFVDVYEAAERGASGAPAAPPQEVVAPPLASGGTGDGELAAAMAEAVDEVARDQGPGGSSGEVAVVAPAGSGRPLRAAPPPPAESAPYRDPFREAAPRDRPAGLPPRAARAQPSSGSGRWAAVGVVLLALGGGGWLAVERGLLGASDATEGVAEVNGSPLVEPGASSEEAPDLKKKMRTIRAQVVEAGEDEVAFTVEDQGDDVLLPVRPEERSDAVKAPGQALGVAPAPFLGADEVVQRAASTAGDHGEAGLDAERRGDWAGAAMAYGQAAALDPNATHYRLRYGIALYRTGRLDESHVQLSAAARSGSPEAEKWLGHLARDRGDVAGAVGHYNTYLKSSPRDADEIRGQIEALTGR
jgi:hypothetical protein